MKDYDDYIVFLLGADNFDVCHKIRELTNEWGIDEMYKDCIYIAKKFDEYDKIKENYNKCSQYESFEQFLDDYFEEINQYLDENIQFEIRSEE